MERLTIISSDGHAGCATAHLKNYMDSAYHDQFDDYMKTNHFEMDIAGLLFEEHEALRYRQRYVATGRVAGMSDPHIRIKELEADGVVADILYPDGVPGSNEIPWAGSFGVGPSMFSSELEVVGQGAYNRWIAEYAGESPDRLGGLATLQFRDIDAAVSTVKWAATQPGIRGFTSPGIFPDLPALFDRYYDPLWAALVDANLPVTFHSGSSGVPIAPDVVMPDEEAARFLIVTIEEPWQAHRPLWWLIAGGVLDRHPELKVVMAEQSADWIPRIMDHMDYWYAKSPWKNIRGIKHPPSEYWHRQCFVAASTPSREEAENRNKIGGDNLMYGVDYPHFEGTWDRNKIFVQATYGAAGTTPAEARKIFAANAAKCYGFDLKKLDAIAADVGYPVDEVLHAPTDDAWRSDPGYALLEVPSM